MKGAMGGGGLGMKFGGGMSAGGMSGQLGMSGYGMYGAPISRSASLFGGSSRNFYAMIHLGLQRQIKRLRMINMRLRERLARRRKDRENEAADETSRLKMELRELRRRDKALKFLKVSSFLLCCLYFL